MSLNNLFLIIVNWIQRMGKRQKFYTKIQIFKLHFNVCLVSAQEKNILMRETKSMCFNIWISLRIINECVRYCQWWNMNICCLVNIAFKSSSSSCLNLKCIHIRIFPQKPLFMKHECWVVLWKRNVFRCSKICLNVKILIFNSAL